MSPVLSPNTKAILLLTAPLIVGRGGVASDLLTPGEYKRLARHLREIQRQPADLLSSDATELLQACQSVIDQERLKQLLERGFLLSQAVARWQSRAIWVVSRADAEYPRRLKVRLKEDAPAVLYGCGDINILETGGLAVVGSRNVNDTLINYTIEIGRLSAKAGRTLVSGGAKGVDQAAMRGALDAGGLVSGILADSLEKTAMNREHRNLLMDGQLVLLSPYDPNAGFNVGNAMQRNKLIYSLGDAALVVSSDLNKGGTWAGAVEQLDKLRLLPIYVRSAGEAEKGLEALRKKGALPWPNPQNVDSFDAVFGVSISDIYASDQLNHSLFARESAPSYQPANSDEAASLPPSNSETTATVMATETAIPSEILFAEVRKLLTQLLRCPMKDVEVATELQISNAQAKEWLRRLVEEGVIEKRSKPVSYVVKQASLFEQRTPTDDA
ncbi:MAG: DNA-processing protein DprA [Gallionella sp.]|nr:DNA-processing protein DprA [Gallionella sp.]